MNLFKRPWNLRLSHRLLIAACAAAYLMFYRPWTLPPVPAADHYAAAAAMLLLAALPPRLRLVTAVALALATMLAISLSARMAGL